MKKFGTREEYHLKKGKEIYLEDDCPFCKIEEQDGHIVWKGKYWYILHNIYPYSGNDKHLMAVPYKHRKIYLDLSDEEILELKHVNIFIKDFFGENNYFSFHRETIANRSIEHLHLHYLIGKLQGKYLRKMLMDQGYPIKQDLN